MKNTSQVPTSSDSTLRSVLPTPTSPMQQTADESHEATCEYGGHGSQDTISDRYYDGPTAPKDPK